jgi:hypothetical protein
MKPVDGNFNSARLLACGPLVLWLAVSGGGCAPRAFAPAGAKTATFSTTPVVLVPSAAAQTTAAELPVAPAFVGEGSLEARGERTPETKLALAQLSVRAVTTGDVAEMTIEHVFRNDADEQLEGTFRFPMPARAMLVGLAMEIDGKLVEGELVTREKARKVYEETVDSMRDPALLEWENGTTFKLRVFPIEAKKTKRVVLRVVAPLHRREDGGLAFAYRVPAASIDLPSEKVSITVDGKAVTPSSPRSASGEVLVDVGARAPAVMTETTPEGTYYVTEVRAPLAAAASPASPDASKAKPQALVVACDRSRSMLEARALQAEVLTRLVGELREVDRFVVVAGDVRAKALGGLAKPGDEAARAAVRALDATEPDGASDVGALVAEAAKAAASARAAGFEPVVVYLGDASPTWGETRASALEAAARASLAGTAIHVVMLGKSPDETTARALTGATHGRVLRPRTQAEARQAARTVASAHAARRAEGVVLEGAEAADVPSLVPRTLYEGDAAVAAIFVPNGKPVPALRLVGSISGKAFSEPIALASATKARDVGKRWAVAKIEALGRDGDAHKEEMVRTSLAHGVMSKHTSFLVLESEEAYAKAQIARRAKALDRLQPGDAAVSGVSGGDLDGTRTASVSPDHLQPGDPEVRIPAPADAQSVVVVFPFGETKSAVFEADAQGGAWVARFLVDRSTPDGTYEIVVRVTLADGTVQLSKLPYVVDTKSPKLRVTTTRKPSGAVEIRAVQELSAEEIEAQAPSALGTLDAKRMRYAHILTDAKRVEVRAPDGQVISLVHVKLGEFVGTWRPGPAASAGRGVRGSLRVVAVDRALNESVQDVELGR